MESPERRIIYAAKPVDVVDKTYPGELEKTREDKEMVALAAALLGEYLRVNGIDDTDATPEQRVHFFNERQYTKLRKDNRNCVGDHDPRTSQIRSVKKHNRLFTMMTVVHEMAHEAGMRKWSFTVAEKSKVRLYRSGYQVADSQGKNEGDTHFTAFDEGIIEMTALGALVYGRERVAQQLGIPPDEYDERLADCMAYREAVDVVTLINQGLAQHLGKDKGEIWTKMLRGEVDGSMMWMRDVEKTFGEGSLRVLDRLVANPENDADKAFNAKIKKYFSLEDSEDRMVLQAEIY